MTDLTPRAFRAVMKACIRIEREDDARTANVLRAAMTDQTNFEQFVNRLRAPLKDDDD